MWSENSQFAYRMIWYISMRLVTSFFVVLTSILRLAAVRKERAEKWIAEGAVRVVHGILLFPVVLQAQWPDCRGKKKLLSMVRYHEPRREDDVCGISRSEKCPAYHSSPDDIQFSIRPRPIRCRLFTLPRENDLHESRLNIVVMVNRVDAFPKLRAILESLFSVHS